MVLALALTLLQFAATETGDLRVRVTDASGLPLQSSVELSSDGNQFRAEYQTDASGVILVRRLPFGSYRVIVSRDAFAPFATIVQIQSAQPLELPVTLSVAPLQSTVTVRAGDTLIDTHQTTSVQRVGTDAIRTQSLALPGRAIPELVDTQPGWLMEANGVLHPRGSEYQTQYVIDGLPVTDNRSPAFAPAIDAESVQTLSIRTGGYPAEYGRKLGGVIEVVTSDVGPTGFHGSAVGSLGSFTTRTGDASAGYLRSGGLFVATGGIAATDRYLDPPVEENFTDHGTTRYGSVRGEVDVSRSDRAGIIVRTGTSRFHVPNELMQQAAGQRQDRDNDETAGLFSYQHVFARRATADVRGMARAVSAALSSNAASIPIRADQDRGFHEIYVKATATGLLRAHEWKIGGDMSRARVRERFAYGITDRSAFPSDVPAAFDFSDERLSHEVALFGQDRMSIRQWTINAGLRWDDYSFIVDDHALSPRVSVAWSPAGDLVFRASYDRAFQTPAIENLLLASAPATEQLRAHVVHLPVPPSRANFYEAGVSKALRGVVRLDTTYFHRYASQFADDDVLLNTGVSFPVALAAGTVDGVDVKVDVPGTRRLSGSVAYSWMRGTEQLPVTGGLFLDDDAPELLTSDETFPMTQDQRHTLRAHTMYRVTDPLWITVAAAYGSGLPFEFTGDRDQAEAQYGRRIANRVNFDAGRVRPRLSLDLSAGVRLTRSATPRLRLQIDVRNITNRLDVINFAGLFSGTALAPPRSLAARVRAEF
jgi:outer membrane cobalamin receptor